MDHTTIYKKLQESKNLERAYVYALHDRLYGDPFCNFFEIEYYRVNKEKLFEEIHQITKNPNDFKPQKAFIFYFPKTNVCLRRMIYLELRDLVLRYLFVVVISDLLDYTFSPRCFAFRPEKSSERGKRLFRKSYEDSYISFLEWQKLQSENTKNGILLRTDISSFYDTVSHHYLMETLCRELAISEQCEFATLFKSILSFPLLGYSSQDGKLHSVDYRQGLPIGNNTEGYLANIFLKEVDEAMENAGFSFGRYVDDCRIFFAERHQATQASLLLQECLLNKGLNLNSAKTKIIEDNHIKDYIKASLKPSSSYGDEDHDVEVDRLRKKHNSILLEEIDKEIEKVKNFDFNQKINTDNSESFSHFLNYITPNNFDFSSVPWDICLNNIHLILREYPQHSKLLAWVIVKFIFRDEITDGLDLQSQHLVVRKMYEILKDQNISAWTKTRILHHLNKPRFSGQSYIARLYLRKEIKEEFLKILSQLARHKCVALQLNCLYSFYLSNDCPQDLREFVQENFQRPISEPIQNAIFYISEIKNSNEQFYPLSTFKELLSQDEHERDYLELPVIS